MRVLLLQKLLLLVLLSIANAREVMEVSLPLIREAGVNEVRMKIAIADATDESVSFYSGSLKVELGFDSESSSLESIRFVGGRVWATDRFLTFGVPPMFQAVSLRKIGGFGHSPWGAEKLGGGGTFDASRHLIVFDQGFMETFGVFSQDVVSLTEAPMTSGSEKMGRVELSPAEDLGGESYRVSVSLPFDTGVQNFQGNTMVTYESIGTLEASGIIDFPLGPSGAGLDTLADDVVIDEKFSDLPRLSDSLGEAFGMGAGMLSASGNESPKENERPAAEPSKAEIETEERESRKKQREEISASGDGSVSKSGYGRENETASTAKENQWGWVVFFSGLAGAFLVWRICKASYDWNRKAY